MTCVPPSVGVGRFIRLLGITPGAVAACVNGSGGCWSFSRTRGGSPQVRHSFAPHPRGMWEHLAAHLLVIGSAPLTVLSTPGLAEGVI